ncbi:MAG: hypothetical protein AUF65_01285 [Chloroflexi bacterium 13_1_20CM_50_12]|nr:MAG: hypothetical protein AUF65_01285 [Chloroflexi bacterium 13_1_20CM_50_12]
MYDTEWSKQYLESKGTAKSAVKALKAHIMTIIQKQICSLEKQEQIGYKMNNMMLVHRKTGGIDACQQILAEIELLETL